MTGMTDEHRKRQEWTLRYVERGTRDDMGYVIPNGWWIAAFEEGAEDSIASIHIAEHRAGPYAAASLAAVVSHLLNTYESERITTVNDEES